MMKKLLSALLAILMTLSLAACDNSDGGKVGGKVDIPTTQTAGNDFQKNMHQSNSLEFGRVSETQDGIYIQLDWEYMYYIDKTTKGITILCGKPECEHNDNTCNAYTYSNSIWFAGDKLYFTNSDSIMENGSFVDYGLRLYCVDPNGENRRVVQKLQFEVGGETSSWAPHPIQHRGIVYFPYSGILYAMPLGGDIEKDAVAVWGKESADAGQSFNLSAPRYTLWGDGDFMYFMVNIQQADKTYKDTLFQYDPSSGAVEQVWQTPDKDDVGEWTSTGVSVSQWYVLDGTIYFYLSGGDFWKTDLDTGETVKLADTHEKTKYGKAVFSDDYLCLINSTPEDEDGGQQYGIGGNDYLGGDTIYVYGLDGSFVKELSLKSLYNKFDTLESCELVFCSGSDIYFVADASTKTWSGNVGKKEKNLTLCYVNIDTGEIAQIFNWD